MSEWKEVILRDVVSILGDGLHGTPQYDDNGEYYFINGNNLSDGKIVIKEGTKKANKEEYEKYKKDLNDQTIFVSINGTLGNVALYNNEKCILGKSACYFNVLKEVDKHFIKYVVTNKNFQEYIHNFANGTTIKNVSLNTMREYPFLLPPINEQLAIASILSSLDDKIDLLNRQNKTLEALAETLFRQWFVEEADESWEVGTLDDEFDFTMGQSPEGAFLNENKEGVIFYQGRTDFDFRFPNPRIYTTSATRIAKKFDTLVSVRAPVGDMNMAIEECCLGRGVAAFRFKHNSAFYSYTYYKMRSLMAQIKQFEDSGTVFGSIGKDDFKKLENIIPSSKLIEEFQNNIKPLDDKIYFNTKQIRTLTQLRDTLLPKLMSGEVRVKI